MWYGGEKQRSGARLPRERRVSPSVAWVAVGISILLVAAVLTGYAAYRVVMDRIHQIDVTGLGLRPPRFNNSLNILVIGSDSRKGKNARFGPHVAGQRSDTILLLHLSSGLRRAVVLSIPRDSVVPVLSCPQAEGSPGQTSQPGHVEQINATFALGGPGCLWKTIEQTTRIRLDHFLELNFTGFEQVVNDLGGVTICLPYPIHDQRSKLRLSRGLHHVWGATALAYWRVRYIGAGSDLERIQRDQFLMASVAQEVKRSDLFGNLERAYKIVSDIAGSLTTDSGLTQAGMISLAHSLQSMKLGAVRFIQAPVVPYPKDSNWVEWAPEASTLFSAIAHDTKLPKEHRPDPAPSTKRPTGQHESGKGSSALSRVSRHYGGISGRADVCHDSGAFTGPLGGHLAPCAGRRSSREDDGVGLAAP